MCVDESTVRDLCTEAVFERGENYRSEGRIRRLARVDDTVTATVQGSRKYDLRLDLAAIHFDPQCSCPYDGPGVCKHIVAVLLELTDGLPPDDGERIDEILSRVENDDLHAFVRAELASDLAMRERFFAAFGEPPAKSVADYREEIDHLFEDHTDGSPVVREAIDFSHFSTLAEYYRERGNFRHAAGIYRALVEGIDENLHRVDAAYDHYIQTFQSALAAYVECISMADLDAETVEAHAEFLSERATTGTNYLHADYTAALHDLRSRNTNRDG